MHRYEYLAVKERLVCPDLGAYTTFGIAVLEVSRDGLKQVAYVSDVSCDGQMAHDLAKRCTLSQLAPIHLRDVVLDAIS